MGEQVNLLRSLPRSERPLERRREAKSPEAVSIAREYGADYFDGPREVGYGGYHYDGRWQQVAIDIIEHYNLSLELNLRVLDVGCAKGFLVNDLQDQWVEDLGNEVYGLDISHYAVVECPQPSVVGRLHLGTADDLPFPDDSFDLVLSLNTLHNLPRDRLFRALREITRVSRGREFVQVDSYHTEDQRRVFMDWVLTAEWHGYPEEWLALFREAGYEGDYDWTVVEAA